MEWGELEKLSVALWLKKLILEKRYTELCNLKRFKNIRELIVLGSCFHLNQQVE